MRLVALGALIVGILALVISGFSALYARQVARTERDRRHEERRPRLAPNLWEAPSSGPGFRLDLLLEHDSPSGPLAEVSVVITRFTDSAGESYPAAQMYLGGGRPGAKFTRGQPGVTSKDGYDPLHTARWETGDGTARPLRPGESAEWRVELYEHDGRPAQLDLDVHCRDPRGAQWTVALAVQVPPDPVSSVW